MPMPESPQALAWWFGDSATLCQCLRSCFLLQDHVTIEYNLSGIICSLQPPASRWIGMGFCNCAQMDTNLRTSTSRNWQSWMPAIHSWQLSASRDSSRNRLKYLSLWYVIAICVNKGSSTQGSGKTGNDVSRSGERTYTSHYSPGSFFPLDFHHPFTTRLPLRLAPYVNASGELVMEEMLCCLIDLLGCSWLLLSNLTGRFDIESLCAHQAPDPDVMLFKHGLDLRLKAWSTNPCADRLFWKHAAVCYRNSRKTASAFNSQCPSPHWNTDLKIWTFLRPQWGFYKGC